MNEEQLLDKTLEILRKDGAEGAYAYLLAHKDVLSEPTSQLYNFLYCLASATGKTDEGLAWLREAVVDKGLWYRPEVFEDEDLDNLRHSPAFLEYKQLSDQRYFDAVKTAATLCTWQEVEDDKLALVVHGNQQNMTFGRDYWKHLTDGGFQVEYVQSKTVDSCGLFRWEDEEETQLDGIIAGLPWDRYKTRILCGFSAGCNEILRSLTRGFEVDEIILVAPWMPVTDKPMDNLMKALKNTHIKIICGENDEDCLPHAKKLAEEAEKHGLSYDLKIIVGLGHSYPDNA